MTQSFLSDYQISCRRASYSWDGVLPERRALNLICSFSQARTVVKGLSRERDKKDLPLDKNPGVGEEGGDPFKPFSSFIERITNFNIAYPNIV